MEIKDFNPKDAKVKLEELEKVGKETLTDEQGKDITQLTEYVQEFDEYSKLVNKDEDALTEQDLNRLIELGDTYAGYIGEDVNKQATLAGEKKKYAGKYETVEDLVKGINSSEEEKKRILENLDQPSVEALEDLYKSSQRNVTKAVDISKKITPPPTVQPVATDISKIPLQEWIEERDSAWRKVFTKYPTWVAEISGVIPPSKELLEFSRIDHEKGMGLLKDSTAPIILMEEMEKSLGFSYQANNPETPKSPKAIAKEPETFIQGKPGTGTGSKGKRGAVSAEEFERLTPEEQRKYQEGSVNLNE